ncbi:MAG: Fis family transcriptional regulator [Proteobacteria bacterium SG_bin7]|nr:MAG: Fis family transcriptional regulator [Proteobacteria bacterium SG_bin7]
MLPAKILIVDDEAPIRTVLSASLLDEGYRVDTAADGISGLEKIKTFNPDVVLLDIWMPDMDGIGVLKKANELGLNTEFIIMSGHGTIDTAVQATRLGAWDFFEKPVSLERILILLKNILNLREERLEKKALLSRLRKNIAIIGDSPAMKAVKERIAKVAPTESWVLIVGENGTGKELVANNIHFLSQRASRQFVEINCAGIPEDLMESELFGFEKGAFAGTLKARKGKVDLASGGTLFLNEVTALSISVQKKLLDVLSNGKFTRVGGKDLVGANVRVLAASSKNIRSEIEAGRFLEDLYYRLNTIPIETPPLWSRMDDLFSLINHFSDQLTKSGGYRTKTFSEESSALLKEYRWPGNVRELYNFLERIYILVPEDRVEVQDLLYVGLPVGGKKISLDMEVSDFRQARAQFEREYLKKKIEENNGNISKTAESIGLERSYLHRKIKTYGLDH